MNSTRVIQKSLRCLVIIFTFSISANLKSSNEAILHNDYFNQIEAGQLSMSGSWTGEQEQRSLSIKPIVYLITNEIIITSLLFNSDITIQITNSYGELVYEQIIAAITSPEEIISLDCFPSDTYTINLKNSKGGHLYADFDL